MKINRVIKSVIFLAFFMLFACEKQEILQLEETQTTELNIDLKSFEIDELPNLANEINNFTKNSKIDWISKNKGDNIVIDESKILVVEDSIGNTTFSVRMYVPDTPYNVFHNMVLKRTPDGKMNEPFILRYEVEEDYWFTYISSERRDAPFRGNLDVYSISSINELGSKTNRDGTGDQPCYTYSPDNGSNGSNGGSSGSGGTSNGNYGDTGTQGGFSPVGIVWSERGGYVEVGEGSFGKPVPDDNQTKKSYSAKNGECPEDEMLVPINIQLERLCGNYRFAKVGDSFQANVGGLGIRFTVKPFNKPLVEKNIFIKNTCISIPSAWAGDSGSAGLAFKRSFNSAIALLIADMNVSGRIWTDTQIRNKLLINLTASIDLYYIDEWLKNPTSAVAVPFPCLSVPYNEADWCN